MDFLKSLYRFLNPRYQNVYLDYPVDVKPRYDPDKGPHKQLLPIIESNRREYEEWLRKALQFSQVFKTIKRKSAEKSPYNPSWNNGFLPGLDMVMIYTMIAHFKPKRYVEVGSGNSTKMAYKAKMEVAPNMFITSIDPFPRTEIDHLADEVIRKPFETCTLEFLDELEENDILFIDNSHRILPNSDSMVFFLECLPVLKKGVIVHIHDIYLPYDYPNFMCERFYSEQYGLACYLLAAPEKYKTIMPNFYISEDIRLSNILKHFWESEELHGVERHGGSYWIQIQ